MSDWRGISNEGSARTEGREAKRAPRWGRFGRCPAVPPGGGLAAMAFTASVKTCVGKYVTFSGRASRSEYWKLWLFWLIVMIILILINTAIFGPTVEYEERITTSADGTQSTSSFQKTTYNGGVFGTVFWLAVLAPGLAVAARRLHDTGRSAEWLFMPLAISVFGLSIILVSTMFFGFEPPFFMLLGLAALISGFVLLIWCALPSQPGPNKYGPNLHEVSA